MSAIIWFGIVAVWAFVLIPTWVRRSDIHWRSSSNADGSTRDRLARATRVIGRSGTQASRRRPTARPAARPVEVPAPRVVSEVREAVESESPMTNPRPVRPAPRRATPTLAGARQAPPPRVQRARRLVWIGAIALATLLLAFVAGGWWIVLNLAADVALVAYLRYLRGIAREEQAQRRNRADVRRAPEAAPAAPVARHRPETVKVPAPVGASTAPPEMIDLTDDCPTTELMAARAV
ncbi:MAG: hypothetical protein QOG60_214 [Frankiaceae bacterium]|jgi:hypothetical protein|nr:hypothetical protein [Frankiaceae bacterium]